MVNRRFPVLLRKERERARLSVKRISAYFIFRTALHLFLLVRAKVVARHRFYLDPHLGMPAAHKMTRE